MKHTVGLKTLRRGKWDFNEKEDGTKGTAEPGCCRRLGRESDGENCEWDEEVCACVCVFACISMCMQAGQLWQNCRRKGNELGQGGGTGQKISRR